MSSTLEVYFNVKNPNTGTKHKVSYQQAQTLLDTNLFTVDDLGNPYVKIHGVAKVNKKKVIKMSPWNSFLQECRDFNVPFEKRSSLWNQAEGNLDQAKKLLNALYSP